MQTLNEHYLEALFDFLPAGFLFLFLFVLAFCAWVVVDTLVNGHTRRHFSEPQTDTKIECDTVFEADERGPELLEIDTLGDPTPPEEILVHSYLWNADLQAYEYRDPMTLMQWIEARKEGFGVLTTAPRQAPPTTWDHQVIYPDRTNHGALLDCALGASPLPR